MNNKSCTCCHKKFYSKVKTQKFCSRKCWFSYRIGSKHPNWIGGRIYDGHGYILVKSHGHPDASEFNKYIPEHRIIMEEKVGRRLLKSEHVHHINGVRDDNRIENLALLTKSEHTREHIAKVLPRTPRPIPIRIGQKWIDRDKETGFIVSKCKICLSLFWHRSSGYQASSCSEKCAYKTRPIKPKKPAGKLFRCLNCIKDSYDPQYRKSPKYCSIKCRIAYMKGPNAANWKGGISTNSKIR